MWENIVQGDEASQFPGILGKVVPIMSSDEVLFALGHPAESKSLPVRSLPLWSCRYDDVFCKWFQVGLDVTTDKVLDTGHGPDPLCDDYQTSP